MVDTNDFLTKLIAKAEAAGANLIGNVPAIADTLAARIGISVQGLDYRISQVSVAAEQQRLSILMGSIKDLLGLLNKVELALLDNEVKIELLRIQGNIQKALAILRGQFQVELANLKGQQDIELANFEAASLLSVKVRSTLRLLKVKAVRKKRKFNGISVFNWLVSQGRIKYGSPVWKRKLSVQKARRRAGQLLLPRW